jgi:hypothetical protein
VEWVEWAEWISNPLASNIYLRALALQRADLFSATYPGFAHRELGARSKASRFSESKPVSSRAALEAPAKALGLREKPIEELLHLRFNL